MVPRLLRYRCGVDRDRVRRDDPWFSVVDVEGARSVTAPSFVPPAYLWVPPRYGSYGDLVIEHAENVCGLTLDPEQKLAIDGIASHDRYGKWVASEWVVIEPRQNGKTRRIMLPMTLADLFIWPP